MQYQNRPLAGPGVGSTWGLKPQAAVATPWRALASSPTKPKNLAATKALRSRAESSNPFGITIEPEITDY
jgi:hypothetical protein